MYESFTLHVAHMSRVSHLDSHRPHPPLPPTASEVTQVMSHPVLPPPPLELPILAFLILNVLVDIHVIVDFPGFGPPEATRRASGGKRCRGSLTSVAFYSSEASPPHRSPMRWRAPRPAALVDATCEESFGALKRRRKTRNVRIIHVIDDVNRFEFELS